MENQNKPTTDVTTEVVDINQMFAKLQEAEEKPKEEEKKPEDILKDFFPETKTEEVETPTKEVTEVKTTTEKENTTYNNVLSYIKDGVLEDVDVEIGEGDDVETIKLSELKDITPEQLKNVIAGYKEALKQEAQESLYEGLDDRTKKMIELKKAGGDISTLIEQEVKYINPLKDFDLDNEQHQERLVRMSLESQGIRPNVINATIADMKEDVSLDLEAKKIAQGITKQFDDHVESQKVQQLEDIKTHKEEQKEFKKGLTTVFREFNLPENISKIILENSTTTDEYGLTNTDKLYFDAKQNPKLFAEISFMLNNTEEFKKFLGVKVKNESTIKEVNKIIRINAKNIKTEVAPPKTTEEEKEAKLKEFFQT